MNKLLLCSAALALAACEVAVVPTTDTPAVATRIEGTVEVLVTNGLPLGGAVLFRWDCADPPPPVGSGTPVDFLLVPEERFVNGSAPFVFPAVPPETCTILGGFLDRDRDFHYAYTVAGQATAGDVTMTTVTVETGTAEEADFIEPILDVELRAETIEPFDRPAFELPAEELAGDDDDSAVAFEYPSLELGETEGSTVTVFFDIDLTTVSTELGEVEEPIFNVILGTDLDGNGIPDDDNGDSLPDVDWPRVLLFRLDPDDPNKLTESDPRVVLPGVVLSVNPFSLIDQENNLTAQAAAQGIPLDGVTPLPRTYLKLAVPGLVVVQASPLVLAPIEQVAADREVLGEYRVLVMNPNGQLWYLPNELVAFDRPDQGATFRVVDEEE